MKKKWFAFEIGANGGISTSSISAPLDSRKEAEAWAEIRCPNTKSGQVGIVEMVAVAVRESPPVSIKETEEPEVVTLREKAA